MTLYRKYRPQKIEEIDLMEIRETLQKVAASPDIPHAFLFAGPRGAGKTSAARILAKVVNCEKNSLRSTDYGLRPENKKDNRQSTVDGKQTPEPCNKCEQCMAIAKGTSLNVIEIDAASHRGVEDIRALRETVKLSPVGGRMKVYIIDEAHMLTTEAGNALLKTLEEPPVHALFILATTVPEKLPDTVRSRCTTFVFRKGKEEEIIRSLERAVKGEKIKIEEDTIREIARSVDGSFREAHKVLEQLSLGAKEITREAARTHFELAAANPQKLLSFLVKKDAKGALEEIGKAVEKGTNLKLYASEIVKILRLFLLGRLGVMSAGQADLELEAEEARALIELFSEAARQLPTAVIPQLPLELAVVKWCSGGEKLEVGRASPKAMPAARNEKLNEEVRSGKIERQTPTPSIKNQASHVPHPISNLDEQWREIMRQVKQKNHSVEALLRATKPKNFDGRNLEIEVFYEFHKERIEKEPYRTIIEEAAGRIWGGTIRLVCHLSGSKQKAVDLVNITEEVEEDITRLAEEIFSEKNGNKMPN